MNARVWLMLFCAALNFGVAFIPGALEITALDIAVGIWCLYAAWRAYGNPYRPLF